MSAFKKRQQQFTIIIFKKWESAKHYSLNILLKSIATLLEHTCYKDQWKLYELPNVLEKKKKE